MCFFFFLSTVLAPTFGRRHLQCFMICIGFSAAFAMRVNLSVAVVAMMDNKGANPDFPVSIIESSLLCDFSLIYSRSTTGRRKPNHVY